MLRTETTTQPGQTLQTKSSEPQSIPSPNTISFNLQESALSVLFKDVIQTRTHQSANFDNSLSFGSSQGGTASGSSSTSTSVRGRAGAAISAGYSGRAYDGSVELGPLTTRAQRVDALRNISQLDGLSETANQNDRNRCGPSCIVAAALYSDGTNGLKTLMSAISEYNEDNDLEQNLSNFSAIRRRLNNGTATRHDVSRIQDALYRVLAAEEDDDNPYIRSSSLEDFIDSSSDIEELFEDEELSILLIDTGDSDDDGNHFVLTDGSGFYDPWPRTDGQIIESTDTSTVRTYNQATEKTAYE